MDFLLFFLLFTGIIESTAPVLSFDRGTLTLQRPVSFDDLKTGASICVSGVCLTVTAFDKKSMSFDVVEETLKSSKLGSLKTGDLVNLERALRADGRFDGHVVQGHVEGVARVEVVGRALKPPAPFSRDGRKGGSETEEERKGEGEKQSVHRGTDHLLYPSRIMVDRSRELRKHQTPAEEVLWQELKNRNFHNLKFRRQHPVGKFILDFYCDEAKLGIEIDGSSHDSSLVRQNDEARTAVMKERGIRIVRFTNEEILIDCYSSMRRLAQEMSLSKSPFLPSREKGVGDRGHGLATAPTTLTCFLPPSLLPFLLPKGSITLDGVSLTIASVENDLCTVALIPETLKRTTLGNLRPGDPVNIETDILVRTIHAMLKNRS